MGPACPGPGRSQATAAAAAACAGAPPGWAGAPRWAGHLLTVRLACHSHPGRVPVQLGLPQKHLEACEGKESWPAPTPLHPSCPALENLICMSHKLPGDTPRGPHPSCPCQPETETRVLMARATLNPSSRAHLSLYSPLRHPAFPPGSTGQRPGPHRWSRSPDLWWATGDILTHACVSS